MPRFVVLVPVLLLGFAQATYSQNSFAPSSRPSSMPCRTGCRQRGTGPILGLSTRT